MATARAHSDTQRDRLVDRTLAVALAAAAIAVGAPFLRAGIGLHDEGWLFTGVQRIATGELLYRDVVRTTRWSTWCAASRSSTGGAEPPAADGMNPGEYEAIAENETRHWWYRGLRGALGAALRRVPLPEGPRVLDAGCGTGANLVFLRDTLHPSYLGGFDLSSRALELAAERNSGAELYQSDICEPEIRAERLDLVTSCDVICIPGAERARAGLRKAADKLEPGGALVLNLPAYQWLYCDHDRSFHTTQRFSARQVRTLLSDLGLDPVLVTYRVFFAFPLVVLTRLPRILAERLGRAKATEEARSDIAEAGPLVNALLYPTLRLENWLISKGVRLPFGSSVLGVGRKP